MFLKNREKIKHWKKSHEKLIYNIYIDLNYFMRIFHMKLQSYNRFRYENKGITHNDRLKRHENKKVK